MSISSSIDFNISLLFQINATDKISKMICTLCIAKVENWHKYQTDCQKNQIKLVQMLAASSQSLNESNNSLTDVVSICILRHRSISTQKKLGEQIILWGFFFYFQDNFLLALYFFQLVSRLFFNHLIKVRFQKFLNIGIRLSVNLLIRCEPLFAEAFFKVWK